MDPKTTAARSSSTAERLHLGGRHAASGGVAGDGQDGDARQHRRDRARGRALGATILHAPITFTDDYHELSPSPYGIAIRN